jgi:hypothetical protein
MKIDYNKISKVAPTSKETFEGSQAFTKGVLKKYNPYAENTQQHIDWGEGWQEAEYHKGWTEDDEVW